MLANKKRVIYISLITLILSIQLVYGAAFDVQEIYIKYSGWIDFFLFLIFFGILSKLALQLQFGESTAINILAVVMGIIFSLILTTWELKSGWALFNFGPWTLILGLVLLIALILNTTLSKNKEGKKTSFISILILLGILLLILVLFFPELIYTFTPTSVQGLFPGFDFEKILLIIAIIIFLLGLIWGIKRLLKFIKSDKSDETQGKRIPTIPDEEKPKPISEEYAPFSADFITYRKKTFLLKDQTYIFEFGEDFYLEAIVKGGSGKYVCIWKIFDSEMQGKTIKRNASIFEQFFENNKYELTVEINLKVIDLKINEEKNIKRKIIIRKKIFSADKRLNIHPQKSFYQLNEEIELIPNIKRGSNNYRYEWKIISAKKTSKIIKTGKGTSKRALSIPLNVPQEEGKYIIILTLWDTKYKTQEPQIAQAIITVKEERIGFNVKAIIEAKDEPIERKRFYRGEEFKVVVTISGTGSYETKINIPSISRLPYKSNEYIKIPDDKKLKGKHSIEIEVTDQKTKEIEKIWETIEIIDSELLTVDFTINKKSENLEFIRGQELTFEAIISGSGNYRLIWEISSKKKIIHSEESSLKEIKKEIILPTINLETGQYTTLLIVNDIRTREIGIPKAEKEKTFTLIENIPKIVSIKLDPEKKEYSPFEKIKIKPKIKGGSGNFNYKIKILNENGTERNDVSINNAELTFTAPKDGGTYILELTVLDNEIKDEKLCSQEKLSFKVTNELKLKSFNIKHSEGFTITEKFSPREEVYIIPEFEIKGSNFYTYVLKIEKTGININGEETSKIFNIPDIPIISHYGKIEMTLYLIDRKTNLVSNKIKKTIKIIPKEIPSLLVNIEISKKGRIIKEENTFILGEELTLIPTIIENKSKVNYSPEKHDIIWVVAKVPHKEVDKDGRIIINKSEAELKPGKHNITLIVKSKIYPNIKAEESISISLIEIEKEPIVFAIEIKDKKTKTSIGQYTKDENIELEVDNEYLLELVQLKGNITKVNTVWSAINTLKFEPPFPKVLNKDKRICIFPGGPSKVTCSFNKENKNLGSITLKITAKSEEKASVIIDSPKKDQIFQLGDEIPVTYVIKNAVADSIIKYIFSLKNQKPLTMELKIKQPEKSRTGGFKLKSGEHIAVERPGEYALTIQLIKDNKLLTEAQTSFIIKPKQPPTIEITSPKNNQEFAPGQKIKYIAVAKNIDAGSKIIWYILTGKRETIFKENTPEFVSEFEEEIPDDMATVEYKMEVVVENSIGRSLAGDSVNIKIISPPQPEIEIICPKFANLPESLKPVFVNFSLIIKNPESILTLNWYRQTGSEEPKLIKRIKIEKENINVIGFPKVGRYKIIVIARDKNKKNLATAEKIIAILPPLPKPKEKPSHATGIDKLIALLEREYIDLESIRKEIEKKDVTKIPEEANEIERLSKENIPKDEIGAEENKRVSELIIEMQIKALEEILNNPKKIPERFKGTLEAPLNEIKTTKGKWRDYKYWLSLSAKYLKVQNYKECLETQEVLLAEFKRRIEAIKKFKEIYLQLLEKSKKPA